VNSFIKKIQTFSKRFDLWKEGSKIVVGVSGGPDSVCLLGVLNKLKEKYNLDILVAHVNYGLRGDESIEDEKFTEELVKKLGLKIEKLNLNSLKIDNSNLESELRDIRYNFFKKIRKENNFDVIAVAHNQDDQAETVLMRMIRGAGLQGLGSIRPRNEKIIRPLLKTSRKEIINYLKEGNLDYRIDSTNEDIKFFRNKIRHNLIPYLEEEYNPVIKETLSGVAESIVDDYDFINKNTEKVIYKVCTIAENKAEISVQGIKKLHPALQRQVLRQSIFKIKKSLIDVQNSHIEEILKIIKSQKGKSQKLSFKGLKLVRKGDKITIVI
jgi:tRNA(Ile)-lysidine synthase